MDRESIEEILKNIGCVDVPADVRKIAERIYRDFSKNLTQSRQTEHIVLGDYIMKNRLTKLAVAAAVIIVVLFVGLPFVGKKKPGVALANVLAKVEQAKAFMYKMKINMSGSTMTGDSTVTISNEYGMKMEMVMTDPNTGKIITQLMYILPEQKVALVIMPERKKYMRMEFDDDLVTRMKKQNNDPREMIKQIMGCKYTELGRSVIDDVEVEGFHTTDPAMLGGAGENIKYTLWVDAKSWLPVRSEMDFKMGEQMQASGVIYDYQWDIPVEASEFKPVIPEDFTPFTDDPISLQSGDETGAIKGLKFFADILGKYPKDLNMIALMKEFSSIREDLLKEFETLIKDNQEQTEAGLKWREKMDKLGSPKKDIGKFMETMRPVQSLGMFYMKLVQDKKEPVYYGESVGPVDADAVLLRWKVSEDQYRVIFGNLTTADVTAEKLAELEKLLPK